MEKLTNNSTWLAIQIDNLKLWWLLKFGKPIDIESDYVLSIIKRFQSFNDVSPLKRNLVAGIIKKSRMIHPFNPNEDYTNAKVLYDMVIKMEDNIKSFDDIVECIGIGDTYVTRIMDNIPFKGERFSEYYIQQYYNSKLLTYKCVELNHRYNDKVGRIESISLQLPNGNSNINTLERDLQLGYRFASVEEIQDFKDKELKINELNKELETLQEKKTKLYSEIENLIR